MKTTTYKPLKNNFSSDSKKSIVLVAILLAAFFSSCSQEGPEGPAGSAGKDGINGTPGATGAANVIYSDWIPTGTLTAGSPDDFGSILGGYYFTISEPKLTQEILDKGIILVYWRYALSTGVKLLPYIVDYADDSHLNIKTIQKLKQIIIYLNFSDGTSTKYLNDASKWRYILIPGGVVNTGKVAKPDYSKMSYEEVCAHFNLQQ